MFHTVVVYMQSMYNVFYRFWGEEFNKSSPISWPWLLKWSNGTESYYIHILPEVYDQ